nr:caspase family protein [uncultured Cohaesibacter sp.]
MLFRTVLLLLTILPGICPSASAETRALLIGASDYDNSFGIPDLKGPVNDIHLIMDMLKERGINDVRVLLDEEPDSGKPTKNNIMSAFARLEEESKAGDLVYIHMSGHGSRQPDQNGDETDGFDEIFLPSDVKKTPQGAQTVPNALVDDEIGDAIDKIRDKGASVWLVMDSCHSGGGMRDASNYSASRNVDPGILGLQTVAAASAIGNEPSDDIASSPDKEGRGGILAFYAARSSEVAKEIDLSEGNAKDNSGWFGLFSSTLVKKLEQNPNLTYRQLFQSVLSDINNNASLGVAKLQTPSWEGSMIDNLVLGTRTGSARQTFLVKGDEIEAGLVQGLQVGTLVGLIGSDLSSKDYLGFAQVEEVETSLAYLRPVAKDCEPDTEALCEWTGDIEENARFAQVIAQPRDQVIKFSPIFDLQSGEPLKGHEWLEDMLKTELDKTSSQVGISAQQSNEAYDVQILRDKDVLWFGPQASIGRKPVGLPFKIGDHADEAIAGKLSSILARIIRAEYFAKSMSTLVSEDTVQDDAPVKIAARVASSRSEDLVPSDSRNYSPQKECRGALRKMDMKSTSDLDAGQDLKQCDYLEFDAKGTSEDAMDVNRIHIDPKYCIHTTYELVEGTAKSKPLGDPMVICSDCPAPARYSAGYERVFVIASKTQDNKESLNLTGLVENCFDDDQAGPSRSVLDRSRDLQSGLGAIMQKATNSRSAMSFSSAVSDVWVDKFQWRTVPKEFVLRE